MGPADFTEQQRLYRDGKWLAVDPKKHPNFTDGLRENLKRETLMQTNGNCMADIAYGRHLKIHT